MSLKSFSRGAALLSCGLIVLGCWNDRESGPLKPTVDQSTPMYELDRAYTGEIPDTTLEYPDPADEDAGIVVPEDSLLSFTRKTLYGDGLSKRLWSEETHKNYVYVCASKLGLPASRAAVMRDAANMPDVFQSGLDNLYNQQWSHAYIVIKAFWGAQWI
ncbi:MAG: hypothetical protein GF344_20425, partial [Chitinivibrionales bacterium]|nr:hypothetical protein [Chitinivibrionales bacterium]MBD3358968.1 hypothetical protein [Chitinivibrionales bacterium]